MLVGEAVAEVRVLVGGSFAVVPEPGTAMVLLILACAAGLRSRAQKR